MFERYTEKARRTIFFARYEASQFGCPQIETEFLLLGVFREDKALASQCLASYRTLEDFRHSIMQHRKPGPKILTSVDLPLSHESKRVLAYASEESARTNHKHIGTVHLLLGLLREEESFAAQLLREQGVALEAVRAQVRQAEPALTQGRSASLAGFNQWLAEREAQGSIWTVRQKKVGDRTTHVALYAADPPKEGEADQNLIPRAKLAQIQRRIELLGEQIERAIANHEFEKARLYSDEERRERENLRQMCGQFNLEAPPPRSPRLCIDIIGDDLFSEVGKRCEDYLTGGTDDVWILEPGLNRAYTVTKAAGLREFRGEILRIANPPLEMDLARIFD